MMTPFPPKTPMQIGLLKEPGPQRQSTSLTLDQKRQIEAAHPPLRGDNDRDDEVAATADWLAHIQAGRIEVR